MTKTERTEVSLADATYGELLRLRRDNYTCQDFTLMTDSGNVWIKQQGFGEAQRIGIPRGVFNRLVALYQRPRKFVRKPVKS